MNVGSLFSGVGGMDLGFQKAGFNISWQVEKDQNCNNILKRHFGCPIWGDIQSQQEYPLVDGIIGGPPCQDASVMGGDAARLRGMISLGEGRALGRGTKPGTTGNRTGLIWDAFRVIERTKPRWFCLENVSGLLSADGGRSFSEILQKMAILGFLGTWRLVDGAAFGLPLRRDHLVIVGIHRSAISDFSQVAELLSAAGDWNQARPQLRQGDRQPWTKNGRPACGIDYRKLTPEECEIALGFPIGWTEGQPATIRYQQLGNAMAVPVAYWVASKIAGLWLS